jgi:hypothetical protein
MGVVQSRSACKPPVLRGGCFGQTSTPLTKYPVEDSDALDKPAACESAAGEPVSGRPVAWVDRPDQRVGAVDGLPWLFPSPTGPVFASTIFQNVCGNRAVCPGCNSTSADERGTVFQCCKTTVCSRCTARACLYQAERHKLDLTKHLSSSGRVLEGVVCPACKTRERVGFPVNGNYARIATK